MNDYPINEYKEEEFYYHQRIIETIKNDISYFYHYEEEEEEECFEYEIFKILQSDQERIRYFILFKIIDGTDFDKIKTILIDDIYKIITNNICLAFKAIFRLFLYDSDLIPFNEEIKFILLDSMKNQDLCLDSARLIILYICKIGKVFNEQEFYDLYNFAIINDDNRRTSILFLISTIIFLFNMPFQYHLLENAIRNFYILKFKDKNEIINIIFAMLMCKNEENRKVVHLIFNNYADILLQIMVDCKKGENKITVKSILNLIKDYENFDSFFEILNNSS